jgi:flagellin
LTLVGCSRISLLRLVCSDIYPKLIHKNPKVPLTLADRLSKGYSNPALIERKRVGLFTLGVFIMSMVIGTNIGSITAQRHLETSRQSMEVSMERLSSGSRINSAMDDAAGLAIAGRMTAQVDGMNMAVRNANDGVSMLQTAEGGLEETTDILLRMRELAVQASTGTLVQTDRDALNAEFQALSLEITRIAENTAFNGNAVLDSTTSVDIHVGAGIADKISVTFKVMDAANMATGTSGGAAGALTEVAGATAVTAAGLEQKFTYAAEIAAGSATFEVNGNLYTQAFIDGGGTAAESSAATLNALGAKVVAAEANFTSLTADATGKIFTAVTAANTNAGTAKALAAPTAGSGGGVSTNDVLTAAKSLTSVTAIDAALEGVATYRGELGAAANRLEHTVDNLMSRIENVSAARSQIQDTDFATESANLAKAQVLQQAGTAMLAQANATGQGVLSLLK